MLSRRFRPMIRPLAQMSFLGKLPFLLVVSTLISAQVALAATSLDAVTQMIQRGELATAEQALRQELTSQDSPGLRDLLGVVLSRRGQYPEAEQQFEKALAADPDFLDARQHLARLYLLQKRRDAAVQQLRSAARLGPLERDLAMTLASIELAAGELSAGERQLRSVAERFDSVKALLELARLATRRNDLEGALKTLRQAQELAPASEEVLATQARTALTAGLPVPAIYALEPLVRMHPTVDEHWYLMGIARAQIGDLSGSIEALQQALELKPDRAPALIGLGLTLNYQKRYAEARDILTRSLVLDPDNIDALALLAEAEAGLSQLETAERHALKVLAQDATQPAANLALGVIRMQQKRYEEARDALTATVVEDPQSIRGHYQLSLALARLGERELSRDHLQTYRRLLKENEMRLIEVVGKSGLSTDGAATP